MKYSKFYKNPYKKVRQGISIEKINRAIDHGKVNKLVAKSEKFYHDQIEDLIKDILKSPTKKFINLCGPTSAGKTTTAKNIKVALENKGHKATILSLDDFLLPLKQRELLPNGELDYESINTIDKDLFQSFLSDLVNNGCAMMPTYDFVTGDRKKRKTKITFEKGEYIIIEGIHAFNPKLIEPFAEHIYKVYISPFKDYYYKKEMVLTAKDLRLIRRCIRDFYKRGESIDGTLKMWESITKSEYVYIKPYKFSCDYFINSSIDYELCLYANYLKPLLDNAKDAEATWPLYEVLDKLAKLEKDILPENTLLWEFLKKQ